MYAPPEAFIFERKNKPSVTSTAGPLKPRHYKIKVPKVQNMKPGAPPGLERVPRGKKKNQNRERSASPSAALGQATRARPFRSEPPSPGGQATGQASTRARGFAAYPRQCPLAESGTGCSADSAPCSTTRPQRTARSRRRPPRLGPAGSVQTRRQLRPRRPSPTGPARPNCRCDASSGANAGPNRQPAAARTRGLWLRRGPAPHAARASPPRTRYSLRQQPSGRAAPRSGKGGRGQEEATELILTQGSGARGRRNPPSSEAAAAAAASSGATGGGDASPLPAAGRREGGEGRRPQVRPRRRRQGRPASLARLLPPSLRHPPAAFSPTLSHRERRVPRPPLSRTGPAP